MGIFLTYSGIIDVVTLETRCHIENIKYGLFDQVSLKLTHYYMKMSKVMNSPSANQHQTATM